MGPLTAILLSLLLAGIATAQNAANPLDTKSRVKDLARVQGADANVVQGIGLVYGLAGTGDSPKELSQRMEATWIKTLEQFDVTAKDLQNKNVAVVAVSAEIPAYQQPGTYIDVHVSSLGDAKSLRGGRLIVTPLRAPVGSALNPKVYVTAQGGLQIEGGAAGNLTTAVVTKGGRVEEEVPCTVFGQDNASREFTLILKRPDYNVAVAIARKLNEMPQDIGTSVASIGTEIAKPLDAGRVQVIVPVSYVETGRRPVPGFDRTTFVALVLQQELLLSTPQEPEGVVVINERAGTYGVSGYVTVYPGTVQKGNVRIKIPYQPQQRAVGPNGAVTPTTEPRTASLGDILDNLGAVGFTPADIIDLIRQMDAQGLINGTVRSE